MRSAMSVLLALAFLVPVGAAAQKKTTQKKKPPVTTQKKPAKPPVLGTTQMKGDQAVVGTEYTLGQNDPMNIKLNRVEYRADRMFGGEYFREPDKQHKFLVVHFTMHNPRPIDRYATGDWFRFTVVDKNGSNHTEVLGVFRSDTLVGLGMELKPGQKVDAFTIIPIPAKGDIEKLIIQSGDDRVLRFALTGKVKPLDPTYADPDDKSGFTAREELAARVGVTFPLPLDDPNHQDAFDLTVDGISTVTASLTEEEQPEGTHNIVLALRLKNASQEGGKFFRGDCFHAELRMDDGSTVEAKARLLHATAARDVDFTLAKGAEVKCRIYFEVPTDAKPKHLAIRSSSEQSRSYVFTL